MQLTFKNVLTAETSFSLVHMFSHLRDLCLTSYQHQIKGHFFTEKLFRVLSESIGKAYTLDFKEMELAYGVSIPIVRDICTTWHFQAGQMKSIYRYDLSPNHKEFIATQRNLCRSTSVILVEWHGDDDPDTAQTLLEVKLAKNKC